MVKLSREEFLRLANLRENSGDSCKNCYSWWVIDPSAGECRYLSPRMLDDDDFSAKWPVTAPDDWCGDHMEPIRKPEELGIIGRKEDPQDFNQDLRPLLESLRLFLSKWKVNDSWMFIDLLRKIDNGLDKDAYDTVRIKVINEIPDFDKIPKDVVIVEILRLDNVFRRIIVDERYCGGSRRVGPNM